MSDRAFSRKRSRWVTWLPTLVILAIIVAAGVLAWRVSAGDVGRPAAPSVDEAVTDDGFSRFSEGGITYIRDSLQARIDLSEPAPDAAELGLPASGETVVDAGGFAVSVGLYVGEESIRIPASAVTLTTEDGRLVDVTLDAASDSYSAQSALLREAAERFGIDLGTMSDVDARVADAVRDDATETFALGPGVAFGRPATATVSVIGAEGTTLTLAIDFTS